MATKIPEIVPHKVNLYICGNCGYEFLSSEIEIETSIQTIHAEGEIEATIPLLKYPVFRCPNCRVDVGNLKIKMEVSGI